MAQIALWQRWQQHWNNYYNDNTVTLLCTLVWQQWQQHCQLTVLWQRCSHHSESSGNWQRCRSNVSCHRCHTNVQIVISALSLPLLSQRCARLRFHSAVLVFAVTALYTLVSDRSGIPPVYLNIFPFTQASPLWSRKCTSVTSLLPFCILIRSSYWAVFYSLATLIIPTECSM